MVSNVTPSIPGAPPFSFAIRQASCSVSILQTWTYNPQKRQAGSAFALTYRLLLRSGITLLPRYYGPLQDPLVFHRFPGCSSYTASLLRRFRDGTRRASPVALRALAIVLSLTPPERAADSRGRRGSRPAMRIAGARWSPGGRAPPKVRSLVTWIARRKETESLKPIDQIILWDDSEPLGRNGSERRCGLEREWPQRLSRQVYGEGSMDSRT
jgi:hypothetical protein